MSPIANAGGLLMLGMAILGAPVSAQPQPVVAVRFEFHDDSALGNAERTPGTAVALSKELSKLLNRTFAASDSLLRYWSFKEKEDRGDPVLVIWPEVNETEGRNVVLELSGPARNRGGSRVQCKARMVFPSKGAPTGESGWLPVVSEALLRYIREDKEGKLLAMLRQAPVSLRLTPLELPIAKIDLPANDDGSLFKYKFTLRFENKNGPVELSSCGTGVRTDLGAKLRILDEPTVISRYVPGPTKTAAFLTAEQTDCNLLMEVTSQAGPTNSQVGAKKQ